LITGGYLTTPGQETARDLQLISDLGLNGEPVPRSER
jgi:biotin synthase-like enzyme